MKSITGKILLKCLGALLFVLVSYATLSTLVKVSNQPHGRLFSELNSFQLKMATSVYENGGASRLLRYLQDAHRSFPEVDYFFTDSRGIDLTSGVNRSTLLNEAKPPTAVYGPPGRVVVALASADSAYRLISIAQVPAVSSWALLPYYVIVLPTLLWLSYSLVTDIASPLKSLAQTLIRFGNGDLLARTGSKRRDQIGDLSRTFDQMADRIQTLLTAERRLLNDVAHELRSPLARLSLASGLLNEESTRPRGIAQMRRDIERLNSLVGTLLHVTRAEGDRLSLNLEDVNLEALIEDTALDCRVEAEARACRIESSISSIPTIIADRELLRRAIENIIRNAIRHSPEGGIIEIGLAKDEAEIVLTIRDYGPGVPDEMLSQIMRPFFRVDEARDNAVGGVGLGLAIADRAIRLHNGSLTAVNMHPGLQIKAILALDDRSIQDKDGNARKRNARQ